jgi:long-chain acyl-CoA synthetase
MEFNQTLYASIKDTYKLYPNRNALLFMKKYLTYTQLMDRVDRLANGFNDLGIKKGMVVTLAMPNVFEAIFALYALNKLGVVCHLVHPLTPVNQMEKFMEITKSKTILILDTFFDHYKKLINDDKKRMVLVNPVNEFGFVKKIGYKVINQKKLKNIKYNDQVIKLNDIYSDNKFDKIDIDSADTAFLLHSGGTSGEPKTIELSNYAINYLAYKAPYIMDKENFDNTHMLAVLPMFHGFGLCMGIHGFLMCGGVDTLMPKFNVSEAIELIKHNQINVIIGVPSLFEALLREDDFKCSEIKNIQQTFVGGDYVALDLKQRWDERMKYYYSQSRLLEGYGLTEVVTVCAVNTLRDHLQSSVGKPLPGIKVQIINQKTKEFLKNDTAGEIVVSGPTMMNGYLNDEFATNQTIIDIGGERWVRTGDLGFIDPEGYVHFKQRLKRIIKVSGIPVLPSEIENYLMSMEEVKEVAVIGVPDAFKGHRVKLFIAWNKGVTPIPETKLKQLIKENISRYAEPSEIVELEELPKTIIGKINVLELEKM